VSKLQTGLEEINVAIELINEAAANPALAQFHDQISNILLTMAELNKKQVEAQLLQIEQIESIKEKSQNLLDSFIDKVDGVLSKIPLVGGTISGTFKASTDVIKDRFKSSLNSAFEDGQLNVEKFTNISKLLFGEMLSTVGAAIKAVISNPLLLTITILSTLAISIFKVFSNIDSASANFRKNTGLVKSETREIDNIAIDIWRNTSKYGASLEDAYGSVTSIYKTFKSANFVTEDLTDAITLMNKNLNVSTDNGATLLHTFMMAGNASEKTAIHLAKGTAALSAAVGVGFDSVASDIANNSEFIYSHFRGLSVEIAKAAVHAAALGISLSSMSRSTEKLLDFQSSIQSEMKASAFFGTRIDMTYARQLGFMGKQKEANSEILRQIKKIGEFDSLNYAGKKLLAEATGYSVDELSKMVKNEQKLNETLKDPAKKKAYDEAVASLERMKELSEDPFISMQNQTALSQFNNAISNLGTQLAVILTPFVAALSESIIFISKAINWISDLSFEFLGLNNWLKYTLSLLAGFVGGGLIVAIINLFKKLGKVGKSMFSGLIKNFKKLGKVGKSMFSGLIKNIKEFFNGAKSIASGIMETLGNIIKGIGKGFVSVMKSIGTGISAFFDSLAKAGPSSLAAVKPLGILVLAIIGLAAAFALASVGFEPLAKLFSVVADKVIPALVSGFNEILTTLSTFLGTAVLLPFAATGLVTFAGSIMTVTAAVAALGAANFIAGDPLGRLIKFNKSLANLNNVSTISKSIKDIANTLSSFNIPKENPFKHLIELSNKANEFKVIADSVNSINKNMLTLDSTSNKNKSTTAGKTNNTKNEISTFEAEQLKLLTMIAQSIKNIKVEMDGRAVGKVIANATI